MNREEGSGNSESSIQMHSYFPTWRKQLGPFRRPLLGAGSIRKGRKISFLRWVPRKFPSGSTSSAPPFWVLLSAFHPSWRDVTSHLCPWDPCKPGGALLNGKKGRSRPANQSPPVCYHTPVSRERSFCVCVCVPLSSILCQHTLVRVRAMCSYFATALSKDSLGVF